MVRTMLVALSATALAATVTAAPLGLPELPAPDDNPMTPAKIALGDKLFHDDRFSTTGEVSCSTCHELEKGFTDSPLSTSEGILGLTGTRNSPTTTNAAYFKTFFRDGRSPSLEDQAQHPFLNPVEMGLETHDPILDIVASDPHYVAAILEVFGKAPGEITMDEVTKAIAAFERTLLFGDSRFDRYWFGGDEDALSEAEQRGLDLFLNEGRCVSCHTIEYDHALFTDHRFHNIGVGINEIQDRIPEAVADLVAFMEALTSPEYEALAEAADASGLTTGE